MAVPCRFREGGWPASPQQATPAWRHTSPPERLSGLVGDVAPGQADIMQIAVGPLRQFAPGAPAVAPEMEGFAKLRENSRAMMICHRFVRASGHFQLLCLTYWAEYLRYKPVRQTTLCAASHEIIS